MKTSAKTLPLAIMVLFAYILLFMYGTSHLVPDQKFPDDATLTGLLQLRDPANFWQQLAELTGRKEVDHRLIYTTFARFADLQPGFSTDDHTSVDAVKGAMLASLRHYDQALVTLKHVVANSRSVVETRKCLMIMSELYSLTQNSEELMKIGERLKATGEAFRGNVTDDLSGVSAQKEAMNRRHLPYYLAVWFLLLIFPASITEIERRNWLKKFADRDDLRGPFIAFMYSPMCGALVAISALVFLVVGIPQRLEIQGKYIFLFFHILLVWLLCQWPLHKMEEFVKKGSSGYPGYCYEKISLIILNHLPSCAALFSFIILHTMVTLMPLWPVLRPSGATIVFPALFALLLIAFQFTFPYLFAFKAFSTAAHGKKVFVAGRGFRRGIIDSGSLLVNSAAFVCGGLEKLLEEEEFQLLLERSRRKIDAGLLFFDFLLVLLAAVLASMLIAFDPFVWTAFFRAGPGFFEAILLVLTFFLCNSARKHFSRSGQEAVDSSFIAEGRSEALIKVLEKVNGLNFFPENLREGDRNEFDLISLNEARVKLRNAEGIYFPATSKPDCSVLVSLWRSRLAIDWKLGTEEAVFLTSLDYSVSAANADEELRSLAARHSRLGAECVYRPDRQELSIVFCCQKFSAFSAETPLPQAKICEICSGAMKKAMQYGQFSWKNSEKGCVLLRRPDQI